MLSFENDYSEGASEKILQRLIETNMEQLSGYGNDRYCESAKKKSVRPVGVLRQKFTSCQEERRRTGL